MNWGLKITILYAGFVVLILSMVFRTFGYKVDLVSADYYDQELKFQDRINGTKKTDSLHLVFQTEAKGGMVSMIYPAQWQGKQVDGKILFYRPSDSALDLSYAARPGEKGVQVFTSGKFRRGSYRMVCDFKVEGQKYCYEEILFMN